MRKFVLAIVALLGLAGAADAHVSAVPFPEVSSLSDVVHDAAYFQAQTYLVPAAPQITCNLVTGVASVGGPCTATTTCNNTGDDAPAFKAFNTWARANQGVSNQVVLTIPTGKTCVFNSGQTISGVGTVNTFAAGINNLIVEGTGSTITEGTSGFRLGGGGLCYVGIASAGGCSARIQTVSANSSTVTLTSGSFGSGYISRFAVGNWIMIGGLDPQGQYNFPFGDPPNNQFLEWRQITNICNNTIGCVGTAVITLDRPLTNGYLDTWPLYNPGDNSHSDNGGPATIWKMNDTWSGSAEYRGLTFTQSGLTYGELRTLTYRSVTFTGSFGACPTQNETWAAYGMTATSADMEVDKLIGSIIMDNVNIFKIAFQSSSTDRLTMTNSTVNQLTGTPKRADITDTIISSWQLGARAYGVDYGPINCTRCAVASFDFDAGVFQNTPADYSMSSGLITYANTSVTGGGPTSRVFVPNTNIFQTVSGYLTIGLLKTQTVTQDPTNSYAQTNLAGGFPLGAGTAQFRTGVIPQFTCDTCTGDATLVAAGVQAGATPASPLGEYGFRFYTPSSQAIQGSLKNKGKLTSLTIDVTTASTHTGAITLNATGQSHLFTMDQASWTQYDWVPQINLKQTGTRVITPAGITCNGSPGGCAGDACVQPVSGCFTPPATMWIGGGIDPATFGSFSGGVNPQFTITLRTNQGIVP